MKQLVWSMKEFTEKIERLNLYFEIENAYGFILYCILNG